MISVKTSNGRLGDWSEIMLAIVEVKDMKRLPSHERDWSVGSAPNATNRNYFLILMGMRATWIRGEPDEKLLVLAHILHPQEPDLNTTRVYYCHSRNCRL